MLQSHSHGISALGRLSWCWQLQLHFLFIFAKFGGLRLPLIHVEFAAEAAFFANLLFLLLFVTVGDTIEDISPFAEAFTETVL